MNDKLCHRLSTLIASGIYFPELVLEHIFIFGYDSASRDLLQSAVGMNGCRQTIVVTQKVSECLRNKYMQNIIWFGL